MLKYEREKCLSASRGVLARKVLFTRQHGRHGVAGVWGFVVVARLTLVLMTGFIEGAARRTNQGRPVLQGAAELTQDTGYEQREQEAQRQQRDFDQAAGNLRRKIQAKLWQAPSRRAGAEVAAPSHPHRVGSYAERAPGDFEVAGRLFRDAINERINGALPAEFSCLIPHYQEIINEYLHPAFNPSSLEFANDYERAYDVSCIDCDEFLIEPFKQALEAKGVRDSLEQAVTMTAESARLRLLVNAVSRYLSGMPGDPTKLSTFRSELRAKRPRAMEVGAVHDRIIRRRDTVKQYLIYLMPREDDLEDVVLRLAWLTRSNSELNNNILGFKVICTPSTYAAGKGTPKIVVYVGGGTQAAQSVLNVMYNAFCDFHERGLGYEPKFSDKITSFLYVAQGTNKDKKIWEEQIAALAGDADLSAIAIFGGYPVDPLFLSNPALRETFPFDAFPYEDEKMVYYKGKTGGFRNPHYYHLENPARLPCTAILYRGFCRTQAPAGPVGQPPRAQLPVME